MDTILFVDDEANILSALKRELRVWARDKDIEIETAQSARTALELLAENPGKFSAVVSDLRMPVMKGSDFLVEVKAKWPQIVTLLLTGYSEVEEVMKAVKAGIFSYILKPWDTGYLISELEKALEAYNVKRDNERYRATMEEELRWAGEMQRALLKPTPLKAEGVEFISSWRPVPGLYCGGDYYDVIALAPGRYLILVGDVAGHGVRGALVTGILKAVIYSEYVRAAAGRRFSPAAFLGWLNDRMHFELRKTADLVVAFFAAVLDKNDMTLCYSNAGQPHPYLIRGKDVHELPLEGAALGFEQAVTYAENTVRLLRGDVLIAYTDGLVEIGDSDATRSLTPVKEVLARQAYGPDYHKRILDDALSTSGSTAFTDDLTIISARIE